MSKIVYHYCSVETFLKIIQNKVIWLTDVTKSNDSKELQFAIDKLTEELNNRKNKCTQNDDKVRPLEFCMDILNEIIKNEALIYVCCFSEERDLLSQWAMYANNATGIAIGFDFNEILGLKNSKDNHDYISFGKVEYSLDSFTSYVKSKIDEIIEVYEKDKLQYDRWTNDCIKFIIDAITKKAFFYKHPSFEQECEYRLVYNSKRYSINQELDDSQSMEIKISNEVEKLTSHSKLDKIDHYVSRGKIVSYRPLYIGNIVNLHKAIKEIVIGPKSSVKPKDIEMFLEANGVNYTEINITDSESTYI